jgi:hypothetical protein
MPVKIGSNAACNVTGITGINTITVDASQTLVAGTSIVKLTGSGTTASEMGGLNTMLTNTDYLNIAVANDATWLPGYYNDTVNGYSADDWENAFLAASITGDVKFILCNLTEFKKYGASLTNNVRFTVQEALSGGWKALEFMGGNAMVVNDPDCPDDDVYFLSPENLFRAELQGLEFEPGSLAGGQRLVQQIDYEVVMDAMQNIGTDLRSSHSRLVNKVG